MSELGLVRELAKEALTVSGELGAFLWGRAERRLCAAEEFMDELKVEAEGRDVEGLAVRSVEEISS
ncbi:MAG: hypothetical protein V3W45_02370 [Sedimentisphaerales bacterium]